jgi:hypothetical protein
MAKKVKLKDLHQLDVISAIRNEDIFISDEPIEEETKTSSDVNPFTFVNDIRKFKKGDLLDDEQNHPVFTNFFILKCLSMKLDDVFILNYFNEFAGVMTKEQLYIALIHFIPKDIAYYKYIKNVTEEKGEDIDFISRYYECSNKEAQEYLEIMGDEWAKQIKEKFGDLL